MAITYAFEGEKFLDLCEISQAGWSGCSEWSRAYIAGHESGRKAERKESEERIAAVFQGDVERAQDTAIIIASRLDKELDVQCDTIALRALEFGVFEALLFVPMSDYLNAGFSKAYRIAREERNKVDGDGFKFRFSFAPYKKEADIDVSALIVNEFFYVLKRQETAEEDRA